MVTKNSIHALGVFTNAQKLEQAINNLKASGFSLDRVSVIAKDVKEGENIGEAELSDRIGDQNVNASAPVGDTLTAASWGSLLVGLSSLALPGLGAVLAAGSVGVALATSVAGVAVGAAANQNLVKALTDLGIPEERARIYSDRLQQSYYLLILEGTEAEIQPAEAILREQDIQNWGIYGSEKAEV